MTNTKPISIIAAILLATQTASAQKQDYMLDRLQLSVTGGTAGMGIDLAVPIGPYVRLRAGYEGMPRVSLPLNFGIQVGDDPELSASKFASLSSKLASFTGQEVNDNIDVTAQPTMHNFKFLVDVFPFKKKEWHITAGFYVGPKRVGKAFNTTEDMPTLFSVKMYNTMYERFTTGYYDYNPMLSFGGFNISMDPEMIATAQKWFTGNGRMGVHIGDYAHDVYYDEGVWVQVSDEWGYWEHEKGELKYAAGTPYIMEPDADNMVKATVSTNAFKPYIGIGYDKAINRRGKGESGWSLAFDAGVWLWGGTPSIKLHDGVDMAKDLVDVRGKVGSYVRFIKKFKVYPAVSLRVTHTFKFKK